jgi:hypothetical protein
MLIFYVRFNKSDKYNCDKKMELTHLITKNSLTCYMITEKDSRLSGPGPFLVSLCLCSWSKTGCLLSSPKVYYCVRKSPLLSPIQNHMHSAQNVTFSSLASILISSIIRAYISKVFTPTKIVCSFTEEIQSTSCLLTFLRSL